MDYWLRHRPATRLLIIWTDGDLQPDATASDFDYWTRTAALPRRLEKAFAQPPFYLDLRLAKRSTDLSLRKPEFLDAVGTIAAPLLGRAKDDLLNDEVRQFRRTRRWVRATLVKLAQVWVADEDLRWTAFDPDGRRVAATSAKDPADPRDARAWNEPRRMELLRTRVWDVQSGLAWPLPEMRAGNPIHDLHFSPQGTLALAVSENGVELWNVASRTKRTFSLSGSVLSAELNRDATRLFTLTADGDAKAWNMAAGDVRSALGDFAAVHTMAVSPDGEAVVMGFTGAPLSPPWPHRGPVTRTQVALAPDGRRLATAGGGPVLSGTSPPIEVPRTNWRCWLGSWRMAGLTRPARSYRSATRHSTPCG